MKLTKILSLLVLGLMFLMPMSSVFAVVEGWDSYSPTINANNVAAPPSPWVMTPSPTGSWACWPNSGTNEQLPNAAAQTPGQYFSYLVSSTCNNTADTGLAGDSGVYLNESVTVVATGTFFQLSWWSTLLSGTCTGTCASGSTPPADTGQFWVVINYDLVYLQDLSGMTPSSTWTQQKSPQYGIPTTPGQVFTVSLILATNMTSASTWSANYGIDSVNFNGGNPLPKTGPIKDYNVVMNNIATGLPINFTSPTTPQVTTPATIKVIYNTPVVCNPTASNTIRNLGQPNNDPMLVFMGEPSPSVQQAGANVCTLSNVQLPYLNIPQLSLVDNVGISYGTSVAPVNTQFLSCYDPLNGAVPSSLKTCVTQNMFLYQSGVTTPYLIQVQDLTNGSYGAGSMVFVYSGTALISSGTTDNANNYPVDLIAGQSYTLLIYGTGGVSFKTPLNAGINTSPFVYITTLNLTQNLYLSTRGISLAWCNSTTIYGSYQDTSGHTTTIYNYVNVANQSNTLVNTFKKTGLLGVTGPSTFQITLPPSITAQSSQLQDSLFFNTDTGIVNDTLGTYAITSTFTGYIGTTFCNGQNAPLIPNKPVIPNTLFGMDIIIPATDAYLYVASFGGLMLLAALFVNYTNGFQNTILIGATLFLFNIGWLPTSVFWTGIFDSLFFGYLIVLINSRRQSRRVVT